MSKAGGQSAEEEEVFLDANTSPELPRRSARKRKSISDELDPQTKSGTSTGKRHRPLGKMHRTPDTHKKANAADKPTSVPGSEGRGASRQNTQSAEHAALLGGMREFLKEELSATERRLGGRIERVEENFSSLQANVKSLEERMDVLEGRMIKNDSTELNNSARNSSDRLQSTARWFSTLC